MASPAKRPTLECSGIFAHRDTWIHKTMPKKEFKASKSPNLIGKTAPPPPGKGSKGRGGSRPGSPAEAKSRPGSPTIPTYRHIKERLNEALRENEVLKKELEDVYTGSWVVNKSVSAIGSGPRSTSPGSGCREVQKVSRSKSIVVQPGTESERMSEDSESRKSSVSVMEFGGQPENDASMPVSGDHEREELMKKIVSCYLRNGTTFRKLGRNGKVYTRLIRWSKNLRNLEWCKANATDEAPRKMKMDSESDPSINLVGKTEDGEMCKFESSSRDLTLIIENEKQRMFVDLSADLISKRVVITL